MTAENDHLLELCIIRRLRGAEPVGHGGQALRMGEYDREDQRQHKASGGKPARCSKVLCHLHWAPVLVREVGTADRSRAWPL